MFADSMLETSWAQRSRRSWTTLSSFGLQVLVMGLLLLLPLVRPVASPFLKPLQTPVTLTQTPGTPPHTQQTRTAAPSTSNILNHVLMAPGRIPIVIAADIEDPTPALGPTGAYDPRGAGNGPGSPDGVRGLFGLGSRPVMPAPPAAVTRPPRISQMMEGNLIRRVQPEYPPLARNARIQGQVVLSAVISKEGTIENLQVLGGHPMLVRAALDAVRQWRYRPYILNNEPVEVETRIMVNFFLSGNS